LELVNGGKVKATLIILAAVMLSGCLTRTYTVNVYGDAPLSIRVDAEVLHDTDASLPITAKLK
jgi:hypothetical protein